MKTMIKFMYVLLFSVLIGAVGAAVGINPLLAAGGGLMISLVPMPGGVLAMAIQTEIWEKFIVENLFKDNQFANYAFNADQYVLAGKVVHIPNAGGKPSISRNRSSLPASVSKRTDVDISYSLDEFTSDPTLIDNAEQVELSYDKINNVIGEHERALGETVADWLIYKWAATASGQILRTTGSAVAAHAPAATGNRKAMTVADLRAAFKLMNKNNVPLANRFALIDAEMYDQLLADMAPSTYRDFVTGLDPKTGAVGKLFSFTIFQRSAVIYYTEATPPVKKEPGASGATTDNAAVLLWQQDSVERALGQVKFFEKLNDPEYYGNIYSALLRAGGRIRRNDGYGVVSLVQAASS